MIVSIRKERTAHSIWYDWLYERDIDSILNVGKRFFFVYNIYFWWQFLSRHWPVSWHCALAYSYMGGRPPELRLFVDSDFENYTDNYDATWWVKLSVITHYNIFNYETLFIKLNKMLEINKWTWGFISSTLNWISCDWWLERYLTIHKILSALRRACSMAFHGGVRVF